MSAFINIILIKETETGRHRPSVPCPRPLQNFRGGGGEPNLLGGLGASLPPRPHHLCSGNGTNKRTRKKLIKQTRLHNLSSEVKLYLRLASRRHNLLLKFSPLNGAVFTEYWHKSCAAIHGTPWLGALVCLLACTFHAFSCKSVGGVR